MATARRDGLSLSVIVPAYNERRGIRDAIETNMATLQGARVPFELIIVDDRFAIENDGLCMLAEVLIKAKRRGYVLRELPVEMTPRRNGVATSAKFRTIARTARELIRFYLRQPAGREAA